MRFKYFTHDDHDAVCEFFVELAKADTTHINWNWARFEWMYGHSYLDRSKLGDIGLWENEGKIVGAAIYDLYLGEGFCGVLPDFEELYPEVLDYAYKNLSDDSGFCLAVCDDNTHELETVKKAGFEPTEQTETVMSIDTDRAFHIELPEGFTLKEADQEEDIYALMWLFWQGFGHGSDREEFEKSEKIVRVKRANFRRSLSLAAADENAELASYCCLWYDDKTDYAYVEPVCTIPSCRGKGLAKALIYEALIRAGKLGAKKAYVISDMEFYERLGFEKATHSIFYKKNRS